MEKTIQPGPPRQLWAEFLFSRVLVFMVSRANYGDIPGYLESVTRCIATGTPYGEGGFGYPVLAFLFVGFPGLFGLTDFNVYCPFFRAQCFAVDVIVFYLLSRRCTRQSLLVYISCTTLLANLLYQRLDILLGCLLLAALILEAIGSRKLAALTLGASIAFKIIPLLLLPAWLGWTLRRSLRKTLESLGIVVLGAGVPMGMGYFLWGRQAIFFLSAHAERGVQIESLWASIQIPLMEFGVQGKTYFSSGSYNLSTPFEAHFTIASHILGMAASLWGGVVAARLAGRGQPLVLAATSTVGTLILASKVFSPQYLLFFLPLIAWSFDTMPPILRRLTMAMTIGCCALTTWVYPYHEKELVALSAVATVPLIARNAFFALLVVLLQIHSWRCGRPQPPESRAMLGLEAKPEGVGGR